ncbi:MAG: phage tail tape measure protein, partial [Novosphingobium sp.]
MTIIGTLLVKMALDAAGFRQEMAGSTQAFVDAGRRISQAGMDLAPVSLPILALGRSALTSASEFESGMNVFQATSGATAVQMEDMRVLATQLGADMRLPGTSAADAAEAMIALGQRGLEVNEVFDAAR